MHFVLAGIHANGLGSKVSNEELNISFTPNLDYSDIAKGVSEGKFWMRELVPWRN